VKATPTVPVAAAPLEITGGGGLLIVNVWALEVPPLPPGFTTVTETVPAVATLEAGTVTTSCVELDVVGVSCVAPKLTLALLAKFVPFNVKLNEPAHVVVEVGLMDDSVGPAPTAELAAANNNKTGKIRFIDRS
jgi:hypothetical protein